MFTKKFVCALAMTLVAFSAKAEKEPPFCEEYVTPKVAKKLQVKKEALTLGSHAIIGDGYLAMEISEYRLKNKGGYFKVDVMVDGCKIRRIEYIKP